MIVLQGDTLQKIQNVKQTKTNFYEVYRVHENNHEEQARVSISNLIITKERPQSNQLKKILSALPDLCQEKYYKYISGIISTNTEPTQAYFLLAYLIRTQWSSTHHMNQGFVNPIIGIDVPSGSSPIDKNWERTLPSST